MSYQDGAHYKKPFGWVDPLDSTSSSITVGDITLNTIYPAGTSVTIDGNTIITGTLNLGDVPQDDTNSKVLTVDTSGNVEWRDQSTIGGGYQVDMFTPDVQDDAGNYLGSTTVWFQRDVPAAALTTISMSSFNVTPTAPTAYLSITTTGNFGTLLCGYRAFHNILLYFDGAFEECFVVHNRASSKLMIMRKNGSSFPAVQIDHKLDNFPGIANTIDFVCTYPTP